MQFLDCVDRRDGAAAARLLHADAVWRTASRFGDIRGVADIEAFINTGLPPRRYGPAFARHRLKSAADVDDLTVLTPTGEICRFAIELADKEDSHASSPTIRSLTRHPLRGQDVRGA
jgi:NADH-quinone oxidoreductase subunit G